MFIDLRIDVSPVAEAIARGIRERSAELNSGTIQPAHEEVAGWIEAQVKEFRAANPSPDTQAFIHVQAGSEAIN